MKTIKTEELMVPLGEYATVGEDATMYEAVANLEKSWGNLDQGKERHRAVLVLDAKGAVVGKLNQFDIIRSLEPRYGDIANFEGLSHHGFNPSFLRAMVEKEGLWQDTLQSLCTKAGRAKVKANMHTPVETEYIDQDALLADAMHQMVMGKHQSLLVQDQGGKVVGILRLSDVFDKVCQLIKACQL